ncbi:MAG TPA: hypothetical protein VK253_00915 [Candidatus Binatia bacterium]|nr:hypothetical protein [Candidatus Binatia bacterium]
MFTLSGEHFTGFAISSFHNSKGTRTLLGEAFHRLYYKKQFYLVDAIARWVKTFVDSQSEFFNFDMIVVIPRQEKNGNPSETNSAALLCDWISHYLNIPRLENGIQRVGLISEFAGCVSRGCFHVNRPDLIINRKILLLDGCICSGANINEAARSLKAAGAASVQALVLTNIPKNAVPKNYYSVE